MIPYVSFKDPQQDVLLGFMLDSGSEINILRLSFVKDKTIIDNSKITLIMGISKKPVLSLGTVNKKLLSQMVEFIVSPIIFKFPSLEL